MKEPPLSTSERVLLDKALAEGARADCRGIFDYRNVKIAFGRQLGHAEVSIGSTKALVSFLLLCMVMDAPSSPPP